MLVLGLLPARGLAHTVQDRPQDPPPRSTVPDDLRPLLSKQPSRMQLLVQRYNIDRGQLDRFYRTPLSETYLARLKRFDEEWLAALEQIDAGELSDVEQDELLELTVIVEENLAALDRRADEFARARTLVPFAGAIERLLEERRKVRPMDAKSTAGILAEVNARIADLVSGVTDGKISLPSPDTAARASRAVRDIRRAMRGWFEFYDGYDPLFMWWMRQPYATFEQAIARYADVLEKKVEVVAAAPADALRRRTLQPAPPPDHPYVPDLAALCALQHNEMVGVTRAFRGPTARRGRRRARRAPRTEEFYEQWRAALATLDFDALSRPAQVAYLGLRNEIEVGLQRLRATPQSDLPRIPDESGIRGRPIGRTALMLALADELIPYTPEELIAIGDAEYAWCMDEMVKASRALGFGDDWRAALEHVKKLHVQPGSQPVLIRELMFEAVAFLREHDLLTVPQVAAETLSMTMMSPARQLVNPFFTGGTRISVSFPTDTMTHDAKLQSMRGNNIPFSRATVHHELIPGHNLQFFYDRRFGSVRPPGRRTPFHLEGWAVYFEMLLYRMGFPRIAAERTEGKKDAENRIGFLFWRMHRSARITFSLRFHLGMWSAQQCIDFLVDGVGHERDNATAEVRRSFAGSYGPLYQAAYLLGAVQFRKLNEEIVPSGKMQARDFHDAIQRAGSMPVALVRLLLNDEKLTRDMPIAWRFYGDPIPHRK